MKDEANEQPEDRFSDFAERIAALARQLFRAICAADSKAVEVTMFYLQGFLVKVLGSHLRDDPRWNSKDRWLDILDVKTPQFELPAKLRLKDELVWATRDERCWYSEPFEFELTLCPKTGVFQWYTFRFGDHRPLAEKELLAPLPGNNVVDPGDEGWIFVFHYAKKGTETKGSKGVETHS